MGSFPQMLCKPGTAIKWAGRWIDTRIVADEIEEADARALGWISPHELLNPLDHDGDGKSGGSRRRRKAAK